jgi:hypothetical protein
VPIELHLPNESLVTSGGVPEESTKYLLCCRSEEVLEHRTTYVVLTGRDVLGQIDGAMLGFWWECSSQAD